MSKNFLAPWAIIISVLCLPSTAMAETETPAPAHRPDDDTVEKLLDRLADARDELESRHLADAVLRRWARANSDTIDLLAARALAAETAGAAPLARQLLDYVVSLAPNWVDGYVRRARVRAGTGDDAGALSDLETALQKEPRRFDALAIQGAIAERIGDKKLALAAIRRALAVQPNNEELHKTEERLKIDVEGRDI
jgi:tetratricopeptide (TPR) repeat protein